MVAHGATCGSVPPIRPSLWMVHPRPTSTGDAAGRESGNRMPPLGDGTPDPIRELIRGAIPDEMCRKPASVLYSRSEALGPGRASVMGLNPGEHPNLNAGPLIDTICAEFSAHPHEFAGLFPTGSAIETTFLAFASRSGSMCA